jgi:hypothetical protein
MFDAAARASRARTHWMAAYGPEAEATTDNFSAAHLRHEAGFFDEAFANIRAAYRDANAIRSRPFNAPAQPIAMTGWRAVEGLASTSGSPGATGRIEL